MQTASELSTPSCFREPQSPRIDAAAALFSLLIAFAIAGYNKRGSRGDGDELDDNLKSKSLQTASREARLFR